MIARVCRRGTALLVVLAVLAVLALLAAAFARLSRFERTASSVKVEEVRARFVAYAGVERAVAEIRRAARQPTEGTGSVWFYRGHDGRSTGHGVALGEATRPSLVAAGLAHGRAYSGQLPGTYEDLGDTYTLRIVDTASLVDLNMAADPRRPDADQPLVRMLTSLALAIDGSSPPVTAVEAAMILAYRESLAGGRFTDRSQLLEVPGQPLDEARYAALAPYVTVHAWSDPNSIAPMDPDLVPPVGEPMHGRISPGPVLRTPRAPVNINSASREVLYAVLAGVSALVVDPDADRSTPGSPAWHSRGLSARSTPVSSDQAVALAEGIALRRESDPFDDQEELEEWLMGQADLGSIDDEQAQALVANADPNVNSHRSNPDAVLWRDVDGFDLVAATTEFSFGSGGVFEIESVGRVTRDDGLIVAQARIETNVEVFRILRHTSQSHFEEGSFGTYPFRERVLFVPRVAILGEEDVIVQGSVEVTGDGGSVHSNHDLTLGGSPSIAGDATASGEFDDSRRATVGGEKGGGYETMPIPNLSPSTLRSMADLVFGADGNVYDGSGDLVEEGGHAGFTHDDGTWSWNGGPQTAGVLYFEGHLKVTSRTTEYWTTTFIATGHISVQGKLLMAPAPGQGLSLLAGTDLKIGGTPGSVVSGVLYAGEQMDVGGNTEYTGAFLARGNGHLDDLVTENKIHGDVVIHFDGGGDPIPLGWETTELPQGASYPEPGAVVDVDGTRVDLRDVADFDGWIGLIPRRTPRSAIGGAPFDDKMMARWGGDSLDADHGGGSLAMVPDGSGPIVASVVGSPQPGHLLADGFYSEIDAVGAFEATGNVGPVRGSIAFWIKPSWEVADVGRGHHFLSLSRSLDSGDQVFELAHVGRSSSGGGDDRTVFEFERSAIENPRAERQVWSRWVPPAHRWTHIVLVYDFTANLPEDGLQVFVDGVEFPGAFRESNDDYALDPAEEAVSPITPLNLLRLGERLGVDFDRIGTSPEATYDELLCRSVAEGAEWSAALHAAGRFYSDGPIAYGSSSLSIIPVGAELLHAAWTVRRPDGWTGLLPTLRLTDDGAIAGQTDDRLGLSLGHRVVGDIRYEVVFLTEASEEPIYEFPVVDDVSIAFADEVVFLSWIEGT